MKKMMLTSLLLVLLVLLGCSSGGSKAQDDNAVLYWGQAGAMDVAVVIADPSALDGSKAAYQPKTGHLYAIILPLFNLGEPVSAGEIAISGSTITFKPRADFGYTQSNFTGTIINDSITLSSIPGTSYSNVTVDEVATYRIEDGEDLLGGDIPDFTNPGNPPNYPDDGDDDNNGTVSPPVGGGNFSEGFYVTNVVITKPPTVTTAYEGEKVSLAGMVVTITYNDNHTDPITITSNYDNIFKVDPPGYTTEGATHTLTYIKEYNEVTPKPTFTAPVYSAANPTQLFYPIKEDSSSVPDVTVTGGTLTVTTLTNTQVKYYAGYGPDYSSIVLKAKHDQPDTYDLGKARPAAPTGDKTLEVKAKYAGGNVTLEFGRGQDNSTETAYHYTIASVPAFTTIEKVKISQQPSFKHQFLFDDPRFFAADKLNHWLSHLADDSASIGIVYSGTTDTKSIRLAEAAIGRYVGTTTPEKLVFDTSSYPDFPDTTFKFKYSTEVVELDIPLYDTLASIAFENSNAIVLKNPDDEDVFLRQARVSAIYQLGSNKSITVKKSLFSIGNVAPNPVGFITKYTNGEYETNVKKTGILTTANSNNYTTKGKTQKATVSFTTYFGKDSGKAGTTEGTDKFTRTASLEVGVVGY